MKYLIFLLLFLIISPRAFSQLLYGHLPWSLAKWENQHNGHVKSMSLCLYDVGADSGKQNKKFIWRLFNMYNKQGYYIERYSNFIPSDTAGNSTRILIKYSGFKKDKVKEYKKDKGTLTKQTYYYTYKTLQHGCINPNKASKYIAN